MASFLADPLEEDLTKCPGIGAKNAENLKKSGIENLPQLMGKYMSYCTYDGEGTEDDPRAVDVFSVNQHFWHFLQGAGVSSYRSGIVDAINKKVAQGHPIFADDEENYRELGNQTEG